jgi:hypothetical protein
MKMVVNVGLDLNDSSLEKNDVSVEFDDDVDDIHGTNLIASSLPITHLQPTNLAFGSIV